MSLREATFATAEQRWEAVRKRDRSADGHFVYAVRTTGVYGRPSSSARLPKRANVEFFDTERDAEAAGYRRSRRHASDQTASAEWRAKLAANACRLIEASARPPTLARLGEWAGMSPFHFQRVFKAEVGISPKAYARASNSSFRDGADATSMSFAIGECSLGRFLVAQSPLGVCAILLGDNEEALVTNLGAQFPKAILVRGDHDHENVVRQVVAFVETPAVGLSLPVDVRGTAFQERVWNAFREIPLGTTATYAEIARRIGRPGAARAVAQAGAANPLALVVPCHRVVRLDGDVSGCRWGPARTRMLLRRERSAAAAGSRDITGKENGP